MANYCCTVRTNYFHVKDEDKFRNLMKQACGCGDWIELWEVKDPDGKSSFGFGARNCITEIIDMDENEFIKGLQECVEDDDAIIIMEVGNEKLRYVVGSATIITSHDCKYLNLIELAIQKASSMLENPDWRTKCDY